jgi:RNA recognition motif-containing protein
MTELEHRLFVSGLAANISAEALERRFKPFGKVANLKLHPVTGSSGSAHLSLHAEEKDLKLCLWHFVLVLLFYSLSICVCRRKESKWCKMEGHVYESGVCQRKLLPTVSK